MTLSRIDEESVRQLKARKSFIFELNLNFYQPIRYSVGLFCKNKIWVLRGRLVIIVLRRVNANKVIIIQLGYR